MIVAYVRVSTQEQNEQRQIEALQKFDIEKWFIDKASGKNTEREQFRNMMNFVRDGDVIYVEDWSRLCRSVKDLLETIETLDNNGIKLISIKENFDTSTPTGKLMLTLISAINQFERENILERQKEGIEIAKKNGKYKGRKANKYDDELLKECLVGLSGNTLTVSEVARRLNISRQTVYNLLNRQK